MTTERYSRQILLPEVGAEGQLKLMRSSVLVIGAGGLGCPVLQYLCAAGVGHIGIADPDLVELSNLHRQVLYNIDDIGQAKASCAARHLKKLNPEIVFSTYNQGITPENAKEIISGYDLIVEGTDNTGIKYLTDDVCRQTGKPWVGGGLHRMEGELAVYNCRGSAGYRDLYPRPPLPGTVMNCADEGVIGVLSGLVGMMMANECLKLILGYGALLAGKVMRVDAARLEFSVFDISPAGNTLDNPIHPAQRIEKSEPLITPDMLARQKTAGVAHEVFDIRSTYLQKNRPSPYPLLAAEHAEEYIRNNPDTVIVLACEKGIQAGRLAMQLRNKGLMNVYAMRIAE